MQSRVLVGKLDFEKDVMPGLDTPKIHGQVGQGFEAVREAFAENCAYRRELGGACCAYCRGEKVVDLWGGSRNRQTGEPWEQDTMVVVHSATKGLAAMTLAVAHSRGWLDYEERVCTYWPEFAQQGKERITVRQLLAHQAGLYALDAVSYTHLRAHETPEHLVCRLLLEK